MAEGQILVRVNDAGQYMQSIPALLTTTNANNQTIITQGKWKNQNLSEIMSNYITAWNVIKLLICQNSYSSILKEIQTVHFEKMIALEISFNQIESLEPFAYLNAPLLKRIYLDNNQIISLQSLRKARSKKISEILFQKNKVGEWPTFGEGNWRYLQEIGIEGKFDSLQCNQTRPFLKIISIIFEQLKIRAKSRIREKRLLIKHQIKHGPELRLWVHDGEVYDSSTD